MAAGSTLKVWKNETRIHLASERTLIAWLRTAATLGAGALFAVLGRQTSKSVHGGGAVYGPVQAVVALGVMAYGLAQYARRRRYVRNRHHHAYSEVCGPGTLAVFVGVSLATDLGLMAWQAFGPASPLCASLPLPMMLNATPPFLYVTFHGMPVRPRPNRSRCVRPIPPRSLARTDPRGSTLALGSRRQQPKLLFSRGVCGGVSGVHRFTLSGAYAGPVTSVEAPARMRYPRGMVHHLGLLLVLESWAEDPSLAVFGGCAEPLSERPFLGRIRPPVARGDASLDASFAHPYGVVEAPDGTLHVSAQNGGAVVSVDITTGDMRVVHQARRRRRRPPSSCAHRARSRALALPHALPSARLGGVQVEPPRPLGAVKSGALRGLAIDAVGCEHVADKHADAVWHYCPGDTEHAAHTKVHRPIALALDADADVLYVSSLGQKVGGAGPRVVALDLKGAKGSGGYPVRREFSAPGLVHPAGMVVHQGVLYLLEQTTGSLVRFNADSGEYAGALLSGLPDTPETLLLIAGKC